MNNLPELLKKNNITKVVLIDDVFDEVPTPSDLEQEGWSNFFDDLGKDDHILLEKLYPPYKNDGIETLRMNQDFINVIWAHKKDIPSESWMALFGTYEETNSNERHILDELISTLTLLGLSCHTMGRELDEKASEADLLFIDLFLGMQQSEEDINHGIKLVKDLTAGRESNPPLLVLMSRSHRIKDKRDEFRDKADLLGSTFRVALKSDIVVQDTLFKILKRLASHYEDSKRVASFVHAWNSGLDAARKRFIQLLRRLDLSDIAQIRTLLLDYEGQMTGDYLLDIADSVLQYEIEADIGTIKAAQELNKINLMNYPAPHLAGSPELQDLVHRIVLQNPQRVSLSQDETRLSLLFGDILCAKVDTPDSPPNEVLLIVTPACDLARTRSENILVLPGILKPLGVSDWLYGPKQAEVPIIITGTGDKYLIKWDIKNRHTLSSKLLTNKHKYEKIGHLRDICSLQIQQSLLADMGRVGQLAIPPATFPVSVELFSVSNDKTAQFMQLADLTNALCYIGRGQESGRVDHLVLSENACDKLHQLVRTTDESIICNRALDGLRSMKIDNEFFEKFEKGLINVPLTNNNYLAIKGNDNKIYMHIVRNGTIVCGDKIKGNQQKAPFIMKVSDVN